MELAQPLIPGNEMQCVKRLHASFSGLGVDTATATFKYQLEVAFAGKLPLTISTYLLEIERQYQIAGRADTLSRLYSRQRIGKRQGGRDSEDLGGRRGGSGHGGGGGAGGGVKRERGKCHGCGRDDHSTTDCPYKGHEHFNEGGTAWRDSVQCKHEFRAPKAAAETAGKPTIYIEKMTKADYIPGATKWKGKGQPFKKQGTLSMIHNPMLRESPTPEYLR
jgi:hypothetical protein